MMDRHGQQTRFEPDTRLHRPRLANDEHAHIIRFIFEKRPYAERSSLGNQTWMKDAPVLESTSRISSVDTFGDASNVDVTL